jgi:hypothetical protein
LGEHLKDGAKLRGDGFFPGDTHETESAAASALDGVLLKARDAHEQHKAEHLGKLWAWLAVHSEITPAHANYLIELAGGLTYLQLALLGFFKDYSQDEMPDWESTGAFTAVEAGFVSAIEDLGRRELVLRDDNRAVATFSDVNPRRLRTALNGVLLYEAMGLGMIEQEVVEEIIATLMRLGKIEGAAGESTRTTMFMVVPRGKPADVQRVEIAHQVVKFKPLDLGLSDMDRPD